jgi:nucleotide-binding universal stress UspA family protein
MEKLQSILVGVDFSDSSVNALIEAGRQAGRDGAKLQVVHAVTPDFVERYRDSFREPESDIIEKLHTQLTNFVTANLGAGCEFEAQVFVGHPFVELVRAAAELSAGLLVLGSHGLTVGSHDVGNVASKCVRKAPLPVLLVRDSHRGKFETVVASVDFSDTSFIALEEAARLAARDGAQLSVLHVHCPPWLWASHYAYDLKAFPKHDYETEYRTLLKDEMETFVAPLRAEFPGLALSTEIVENEATLRGIRDHLKQGDADVVVIGSRGRTGIRSLLLGTTAERLLHDSPCSVLTVKPESFEFNV